MSRVYSRIDRLPVYASSTPPPISRTTPATAISQTGVPSSRPSGTAPTR
nr:hypothetical protein [Streptomyces albidoflavus]